MSLPASFQKLGLKPASEARNSRRLMIGSDGLTNAGKTEFLFGAPGPKVVLAIDTAFDSAVDNPEPPLTRLLEDCAIDVIKIPMQGAASADAFVEYYKKVRDRIYELIAIPDLVTLGIDGDSDFWELQVLAEYGRTNQIHPWQYTPLYAIRRAINKRLHESGKIIIATNKLKAKYEDDIDENGNKVLDNQGKVKQHKVDGAWRRQGFPDQDYLWQLQIRHLYKKPEVIDLTKLSPIERLKAIREKRTKTQPQWGIEIMKCKTRPVLEGDQLWDDHASFKGLVQYVYPHIPLEEWGY